ncbi:ABC transporter substrate-binding protein [Paenibacillus ferrarius]|uniref:ABC transporter substrate-binding protein n=1 Tax=Paenibacillus ferrarius TaxID=1469647 RepID=UPI003D2BBDCC
MASMMVLSGCSSLALPHAGMPSNQRVDDNKVTLEFIYAGGDSTTNQAIGETVDKFNGSQSRIKINATPATGLSTYDEYLKKKAAVGEFPDFLDMRDTQTYADAGKIVPLPQSVVDLLSDPAKVNGQVYTAPLVVSSPLGIIYNKKLFADAGITDEPRTWDEFLAICQKIKEIGVSPLVVGGKDLWHMGFWQSFFMNSYMFADNLDWNKDRKAGKVHFSDGNVVSAMKDMTELWTHGYVEKGWLTTPDYQVASVLVSGKAAMLYEGSWMFNTIKQADPDFQFGFFVPRDRKGRVITVGKAAPQGIALTVKGASDAAKVAAFTEFMAFFYRNDVYSHYLKITNGIPGTKQLQSYDAPEETQKVIQIMNDPLTIKTQYMHAFGGDNQVPTEFRDWLWKLTEQWLSTGNPSVEEAMKMADEEFDNMMTGTRP